MKKIKIKVPEILEQRGLDFNDLHYGARISLNTAKRWASHQDAQEIDRIDKDTLESIAAYLDEPIEQLIEIQEG